MRTCIEQGWQGFRADWYANLRRPTAGSQRTGNQGMNLTEQNRAAIAEARDILFGSNQRGAQ